MYSTVKKIPLTKGKFALIDEIDYENISKFKWCYESFDGCEYAARKDSNNKTIRMHQMIMGKVKNKVLDHKDRNGLNNTRSNLRFVTRSENAINTFKTKGYYFDKRRLCYRIKVQVLKKAYYLGSTKDELVAQATIKKFKEQFFK